MNLAEKTKRIAELCWWYDAWRCRSHEGAGRTPGRKSLELHLNICEAEVLEIMESDAYLAEVENLMLCTRQKTDRDIWIKTYTDMPSRFGKRMGLSEEKVSGLIARVLNKDS